MDEPAMRFDGVVLSPQKDVVRVFFKELWDHADKGLIPRLFHPDFTFRGSLGPVLKGRDQFAGYVDMVTGALGQYTSDILDMVEEANKVFAKRRYHGYHHSELLAVSADRASRPMARHAPIRIDGRQASRPVGAGRRPGADREAKVSKPGSFAFYRSPLRFSNLAAVNKSLGAHRLKWLSARRSRLCFENFEAASRRPLFLCASRGAVASRIPKLHCRSQTGLQA
jgi:SnoaL-like protein